MKKTANTIWVIVQKFFIRRTTALFSEYRETHHSKYFEWRCMFYTTIGLRTLQLTGNDVIRLTLFADKFEWYPGYA